MKSLLDKTKDQPYGIDSLYDYRKTQINLYHGRRRSPVKKHATVHNESLLFTVNELENQYRRDVSRISITQISLVEKNTLNRTLDSTKPFKLYSLIG